MKLHFITPVVPRLLDDYNILSPYCGFYDKSSFVINLNI